MEGGKGLVYGKKKVDFSLNKCGVDELKAMVKPLFNQVIEKINSRTLNGDGEMVVDLFELFWGVRKNGGFDLVSRKNSWGGVAEECGFGFEERTSMELIYRKYLRDLDRCLEKEITEIRLGDDGSKVLEKLGVLLDRLNQCLGFGDYLLDVVDNKNDETKNDPKVSDRSSSLISPISNQTNDLANGNLIIDGEKLINVPVSEFYVFPNKNEEGDVFDEKSYESTKRSREESNTVQCSNNKRTKKEASPSWTETLDWLSHVATHFDDPGTGILSECWRNKKKKKKARGNHEPLWNRALLARKLLSVKKDYPNADSSRNQNYKMHPSMYEDIVAPSRISQRIPLVKCHYSCACTNPAAKHNRVRVPKKKVTTREPVRVRVVNTSTKKPVKHWEKTSEMHCLLGHGCQAVVPIWTPGEKPASDLKWLGTRIWSPEDAIFEEEVGEGRAKDSVFEEEGGNGRAKDAVFEEEVGKGRAIDAIFEEVGKGRPLRCDCLFPGSTECVRFHISEKRLQLKREINSAFYKWRFHQMGEEVSLFWTEEEEQEFKDMIKFYSAERNKFWKIALELFFPSRTRKEMVRYYFNVLVLRRRSYQNRATPSILDSDDDDKDYGAVGSSFDYRSMYFVDSSLGVCSLNMQRTDFV